MLEDHYYKVMEGVLSIFQADQTKYVEHEKCKVGHILLARRKMENKKKKTRMCDEWMQEDREKKFT